MLSSDLKKINMQFIHYSTEKQIDSETPTYFFFGVRSLLYGIRSVQNSARLLKHNFSTSSTIY